MALVYAEHRHFEIDKRARRAQQRAVAAHDDQQIFLAHLAARDRRDLGDVKAHGRVLVKAGLHAELS